MATEEHLKVLVTSPVTSRRTRPAHWASFSRSSTLIRSMLPCLASAVTSFLYSSSSQSSARMHMCAVLQSRVRDTSERPRTRPLASSAFWITMRTASSRLSGATSTTTFSSTAGTSTRTVSSAIVVVICSFFSEEERRESVRVRG
ncbi:40S ribosomal protein S12, putative [Leishmania tarentolae]|uniref:40S ribosomal protein S12, putative n=1 Tax=Leishmania tarentolae TaxID=5689 RepID=A0A640KGQ4_LEITA|nr:40S ribosomal protein S12, putative [Leishmania tarentolae]